MKRAQRVAMRQKARSKWDYVDGMTEEDEISELLDWHLEHCTPIQLPQQQPIHQVTDSLPF